MSTTVLEALENAKINFENARTMGPVGKPIYDMAVEQLGNAIEALENDFGPHDIIQESMFSEVVTSKD